MPGLPTGTVTFLFTDIEGSTLLLEHLGDRRYADILAVHHQILRAAFASGGHEIDTQGDAFFVVFQDARDAAAAALAAQRAIGAHPWPDVVTVRVRMGLHTGTPTPAAGGYIGLDVHRAARICAAGHGGQTLLSFETARALEQSPLPGVTLRDLGSHRLKDLQQPEKIFQILHLDLPADFPPLKSLDLFANNLPRQLTSFVGREREMVEVKRLLKTTSLLSLTGTGGAGKTRLALQVAADVLEEYPDGVWLVELAALSDPTLVPQTAASALGVREVAGRPILEVLLNYLQRKKLLLVLDNCEHLVAACARLVGALLRTCPGLRVLATSREILGVQGELAWRVPSLSLPDLKQHPALEHLTQFEAVRLFIERAAAAQPMFTLTPQNAVPVAAVVQRLDGIPLAIELAAARIPALSVEQIATRLDDRFRLLTRGARTTLPRHQTLRATLDWSYQLLAEREQLLLRRLSVFAGSWTLEAAEAVCGGDGIEGFDVIDLLTQLVFKSLVLIDEQDGHVRYRFLETVRQYGLEKLAESGEVNRIRGNHHDWFLRLAEQAAPQLRGLGQTIWMDRLETEHDNLRAALEWSDKTEDAQAGLRLAGALVWFWSVRGYIGEGRERLASVLSKPQASDNAAARAEGLWGAGILARQQGDYVAARALFEESLAIRRTLGDRRGIADTLNSLGLVTREQGDYASARALHEESLALRRGLGDQLGIANALTNLGLVAAAEGDYQSARRLHEESLVIKRKVADKLSISYTLNNLADVAYHQENYASARDLYEESLAIKREVGDKFGIAYTLNNLGRVAHRQGDYESALRLYAESLGSRRALGERSGIAECLEGLAAVAGAQGQGERAVRLFGAAEALREIVGAPLPPSHRADYVRTIAHVRAGLEERVFSAAWSEGRAMTVEQAVGFALNPHAD